MHWSRRPGRIRRDNYHRRTSDAGRYRLFRFLCPYELSIPRPSTTVARLHRVSCIRVPKSTFPFCEPQA
jgi:hypothetical protein